MSFRGWVILAASLFVTGLVLGLTVTGDMGDLISRDLVTLQDLSELLASLPLIVLALVIFLRNASILVMSFLFSPFLCLVPVIALLANGWVISFLAVMIAEQKSVGFVLAGLLPHGILEIPAFIIGEAAALSFGAMLITSAFHVEKRSLVLPNLKQNLKYLSLAVILLVPAALIETYITPLFLK
jgi:stage II sporulation protein M